MRDCHLLTSLGLLREDATDLLLNAFNTPSLHTEEIVKHRSHEDIEDNEGPDNTEVSPAVGVVDLRLRRELIGNLQRAVLAARSSILVEDLTTSQGGVLLKVLPACLARWGVED